VLEVAKKIYLENSSAETDLPLANVYSRLADISRVDGHYQEALRDYTECLRLRQAALPPTSRDLADVLYNMGVCHVYLSNEQGSFKQAELREAISKYSQARDILKKRSEEESTPSAEKDDLRSIVEDLGEEIEALQQELEQEGAGASSSSSHLPTTSIGFGGASDSSAGAAAPAAGNGAAQRADSAMLLQVRSKKKRPEVSQTPASTGNDDSEAKRVRS
jgi:tetratricopeptide (TPR) repeat protein